jgi:hypothetical protein
MAGIFPDGFGTFGASGGVLPFGPGHGTPNWIDAKRNAILGYLAGALQGGNLGQSIGHGLEGWMRGAQADQSGQSQRSALQYVAEAKEIDPAIKQVLAQSPALAMQYLAGKMRPAGSRAVTEYEYAKRQGFTGSFADWIGRNTGSRLKADPSANASR